MVGVVSTQSPFGARRHGSDVGFRMKTRAPFSDATLPSFGSNPTLPIQSDTRRAYWRVVMPVLGPRRPANKKSPGFSLADCHDIAATKLAVDRQIEYGEVSDATFNLEFRPD
jgi:hypothetical protein